MDQTKKQPKSFLEIIKEDPSRKDELLAAAASLTEGECKPIIDDDDLDDPEVIAARKKDDITLDRQTWPVVTITVKKMNNFILNNTDSNRDLLIFYLATYKNERQVKRYNKRNGTNWTLNEMKGRPTLLLDSESNFNSLFEKLKIKDMGRICPPPKGCDY